MKLSECILGALVVKSGLRGIGEDPVVGRIMPLLSQDWADNPIVAVKWQNRAEEQWELPQELTPYLD